MAGIILVGAIYLQPKFSAWLTKVKERRAAANDASSSSTDGISSRFSMSLKRKGKGKAQGGSTNGGDVSLTETDVGHCLLLLMLARELKKQNGSAASSTSASSSSMRPNSSTSSGTTASDSTVIEPSDDLAVNGSEPALEEPLPQYSAKDPAQESTTRTSSQVDSAWSAILAQAMSRLELFCLEILPLASRFAKDPSSESKSQQGRRRRLPDIVLPPPDVCLAWACTLAGPGHTQLLSKSHSLSKLVEWEFPLSQIASQYARGSDINLAASEKQQQLWTQTTGSPWQPRFAAGEALGEDVLSKGLRVRCPSPACSFAGHVPYIDSAPSTRSSEASLTNPRWRRKCQQCRQSVSLDTLVGRRLIEDISVWCNADHPSDHVYFEGLAYNDRGQVDPAEAELLSSQLLAPLFSPALTAERKRRTDALATNGSLGSDGARNSNSLGSALRQAAASTVATDPMNLGVTHSWSFSAIETWLETSTLKVNPMPALAGSKDVGMPDRYAFPDRMGGGFSAGGVNFTAENPYEEEGAKMSAVQTKEKRERLLAFVGRLLEPYRRFKAEGLPSVAGTIKNESSTEAWTDVVLGIKRPTQDMLKMEKELQQLQSTLPIPAPPSQVKGQATPPAKSEAALLILSSYRTTLKELKSTRTRSGITLKRAPLDLKEVRSILGHSTTTPIEVRLGRLAHELQGHASSRTNESDDDSYAIEMEKALGVVARGLLGS